MVKALHIFLLVDGQAAMRPDRSANSTLAVLIPDLVSLLVLVKSTLKACCLPQEGHTKLVKNMLLLPVGPGLNMLNLLQVRHIFTVRSCNIACPALPSCNLSVQSFYQISGPSRLCDSYLHVHLQLPAILGLPAKLLLNWRLMCFWSPTERLHVSRWISRPSSGGAPACLALALVLHMFVCVYLP